MALDLHPRELASRVNWRALAAMREHRIIFITHSKLADPGAVAEALHALGYETQVCCPFLGDRLPPLQGGKPDGYAASIVFGGPMVVRDAARMAFIAEEIKWLGGHLESGAPLLGICLGAQMMAHALGARVWEQAEGLCEIGYHAVAAAPAGRDLFPARLGA